jgi:hypothetical protein
MRREKEARNLEGASREDKLEVQKGRIGLRLDGGSPIEGRDLLKD